jgi:hypothetical protein
MGLALSRTKPLSERRGALSLRFAPVSSPYAIHLRRAYLKLHQKRCDVSLHQEEALVGLTQNHMTSITCP